MAVGAEQRLERLFDQRLLVGGQFADGESGELALFALDGDSGFRGGFLDECPTGLFGVERLEHLVHLLGLVVEQVVLGVLFAVSVDDGTTERDLVDAVAIGPHGQVATGQFPFELAAGRVAEQRHAVRADTAVIVFHLLLESLVAFRRRDVADDLFDQGPLILRVKILFDERLGDMPVGVDSPPQFMLERKADRLLLRVAERRMEAGGGRFGGALHGWGGERHTRIEQAWGGQTGGDRGARGGLEERTAMRQARAIRAFHAILTLRH